VALSWLEQARRVLAPNSAEEAVIMRAPSRMQKLVSFAQKGGKQSLPRVDV
jgi:hypothetical protein